MARPTATSTRRRPAGGAFRPMAAMLFAVCLLLFGGAATAAPAAGSAWQRLSPMQREALAPLKDEWAHFSADRRRKWLNIASRYPAMTAQQRQVLQRRMVEWVHMTPRQRRLARENYLAAGRAPVQSRRQAWERYQRLSLQQRRELERQAHKPPRRVHVVQYGTVPHRPARATSGPNRATLPPGSAPAATLVPAAMPGAARPAAATSAATRPGPRQPAAGTSAVARPAPPQPAASASAVARPATLPPASGMSAARPPGPRASAVGRPAAVTPAGATPASATPPAAAPPAAAPPAAATPPAAASAGRR